MNAPLLEELIKTMENIPPKAIFRLAEIQRKMIEDDVANKRIACREDVNSVLSFCRFLESSDETEILPILLPVTHIAACRKIVEKLIAAGELSPFIKERFDQTFYSNFLHDLTV
jgi:hypothetical protein